MSAKIVPAEVETGSSLYQADFYTWTLRQSAALREGRSAELDTEHLAEEIEDLGRELFLKLRSSYRIILLHLLKWDHQPERRSRSWALSIRTHRLDLLDLLDGNPGLKGRRDEALAKAYRVARLDAAKETGLRESTFPETVPYSLDEIMARPIEHSDD